MDSRELQGFRTLDANYIPLGTI